MISVLVHDDRHELVWAAHRAMDQGLVEFRAWLDPGDYTVVALGRGDRAASAPLHVAVGQPAEPLRLELR